jgi:hypothetical protein
MKKPNDFFQGQSVKSLVIPALLGALAPFAILLLNVLMKQEIFETWMLAPLILIPLGGAFGEIFLYLVGFDWFPIGNKNS